MVLYKEGLQQWTKDSKLGNKQVKEMRELMGSDKQWNWWFGGSPTPNYRGRKMKT